MYKHISDSKNEYNVRRVEELNVILLEKERELKNTVGFINRFKLKLEIKKIYRKITIHGSEVLQYETTKFNYNLN